MNQENLFLPTEGIGLDDMIILQPFVKTFYFKYIGTGDTVIAKLSGRPSTTGLSADSVVHEPGRLYSVRVHGAPKVINKNNFVLKVFDNKENITEFPITFQVAGLEIQKADLPDAIGLRKEYVAKISFKNPTCKKPKFTYNFPVEFGRVFTEGDDGSDYTTIRFYPTKEGDYKFYMQALCEANDLEPEEKDIVMGGRTLHIKVIDTDPKPEPGKLGSVKSVDIKDWR